MLAVVNPRCDYGRGLRTWHRIEPALRARHPDLSVEEIPTAGALFQRLNAAVAAGERAFVAAGGDGTVNAVANGLLWSGAPDATLGAVALGSSNDYHKPLTSSCRMEGVPTKLEWDHARWRDAIMVRCRDGDGRTFRRAFLINAGIGITAHANAVYNSHIPLIRRIQHITVEGAILASVGYALKTFRPLRCRVSIDHGPPASIALTNLAVLKSPHVGGALCYDTPVAPDDGRMAVALCMDMSRRETLGTLISLYRRRFVGLPKTVSLDASTVTVSCAAGFTVEMDGEVVHAVEASFDLAPRALRCCP